MFSSIPEAFSKENKSNTFFTMLITAIFTLFFFTFCVIFLVGNLEFILNMKRTLFFSAILSAFLIPVGFYFGAIKKISPQHLFFVLAMVVLALSVRISLFDFESADYLYYLNSWTHTIKVSPGLSAWRDTVGDYNMPYLYFLTVLAKQPLTWLYLIKIFSIVFDFILAYYAMRTASIKTDSIPKQLFVFFAVLFLPTVILNSAYWAQCDAIFTALSLGAVYYGVTKRPKACVTFFALAFSFKLQTIFALPILIVFVFTKRVKLKHLALFPTVFFATLVPALLAGKPFIDTISIYIRQADQYPRLTLNAPSVYNLMTTEFPYTLIKDTNIPFDMFNNAGIFFAGMAVFSLLYFLFCTRNKLDTEDLLTAAFLFSIIIPFLLPRMHERYFYMADIFAIIPFIYCKKRWFVPAAMVYASFRSYTVYLFGDPNVNFLYLSIMVALIIIFTLYHFVRRINANSGLKSLCHANSDAK